MNFQEKIEIYKDIIVSLDYCVNDYLYILEGLKNKNNGILNDVDNAIVFLMRCLKKYYGKDVMLFIDEYDTPFIEAKTGNFYQELKGSLATLLRSSLKNSEDLKWIMLILKILLKNLKNLFIIKIMI